MRNRIEVVSFSSTLLDQCSHIARPVLPSITRDQQLADLNREMLAALLASTATNPYDDRYYQT
jgi:hypothetical protein